MPLPSPENHYGAHNPGGTSSADEGENVHRALLASTDRRARVATSNLTKYPERTIGALNNSEDAGQTSCTGTMVGPRAVLTASHCVLDWDGSADTLEGFFHPGQTNTTHPNAGGTAVEWSGFLARNYTAGVQWDYAILFLEDRPTAVQLGWLGIAWWTSSSSYVGVNARLLGYPRRTYQCAASPHPLLWCDGWMYRDQAYLDPYAYFTSNRLRYDIDTQDGQSGSAVFTSIGGDWAVLGVHSGHYPDVDAGRNMAARFRQGMYDDVCDWIAYAPSAHGAHEVCN